MGTPQMKQAQLQVAALRTEIERLTRERDDLRADLSWIEKLANIPAADDSYGSLTGRMQRIWLRARGSAVKGHE